MKYYHLEKLFNGYASVRDYLVNTCVNNQEDLLVVYQGKSMTLTPQDLISKRKQFSTKRLTSKWRGSYMLFDFKFESDEIKKKQLLLNI